MFNRDKKTPVIISLNQLPENVKEFYGKFGEVIEVKSEPETNTDSKDEDAHLDILYGDKEQKRKERLEAMFNIIASKMSEDDQPNFSDNIQQLISQINWPLVSVLVCNGLFITANLAAASNEVTQELQLCLSTVLPILCSLMSPDNFKDIFPGAVSGMIASELNRQGAPLWAAPALTISLATVVLTENKLSNWVSNKVSNSVNHVFNMWHRSPAKPDLNKGEQNMVIQRRMPGK